MPASVPSHASGLLLRHGGSGPFAVPATHGYAGESELQQILFEHPDLVPGVSTPAVACREFQSGAGPADVLIVGQDGALTVVECKLASNPQIRREILGQVLDYASRLWRMPVEDFERRWIDRTGMSPFADFGDQEAAVRAQVAERLTSGRFTVVLAVEGINDDLRRMVEYLSTITLPDVQILAFEVARVADGDVEILLPQVYGAELAQAKAATPTQPSWTRKDFEIWLTTNQPDLAGALTALLDEATAAGLNIWNGSAFSPSLIVGVPTPDGEMWPVSLFSHPRCTIQVRVYQVDDRHGDTAALVDALAAIPGSGVDPAAFKLAAYRKRADIPANVFTDATARRTLIQALLAAAPRVDSGGGAGESSAPHTSVL